MQPMMVFPPVERSDQQEAPAPVSDCLAWRCTKARCPTFGATLLEALILLALFSSGALGVLATQSYLLRVSDQTSQHALADLMARDLRERIWVQGLPDSGSAWLETWRQNRDCRTSVEHFCLPGLDVGWFKDQSGHWIELSWDRRSLDEDQEPSVALRWPVVTRVLQ